MSNTIENGFPELTDSFLSGQDIFYSQFNEIDFYVEDTDQENFYFNIFKKMFPKIRFDKIFPLNGKKNVQDAAENNISNKKKVYIVDLDFDEILSKKKVFPNLFYLKRYSIENYLFSESALFELIKEKNPKLKNSQIKLIFDYKKLLNECKKLLTELSCSFILIKKHSLGITYFGLNPNRDFDFNGIKPIYKNNFISNFFSLVETELKKKDLRLTLNGQIKKLKCNFFTLEKAMSNIPGKYIINLIKTKLEKLSLIIQVSLESFTYKLSKEANILELEYLRTDVIDFIR